MSESFFLPYFHHVSDSVSTWLFQTGKSLKGYLLNMDMLWQNIWQHSHKYQQKQKLGMKKL